MTDNPTWQAPGGAPQPPLPQYGAPAQPGSFPPPTPSGWTPPPKPGLIPLRPLQFGTLLGASFQVMRRNPRPTLGSSLLLNGLVFVLFAGIFGTVAFLAFGRIESATSANEEEIVAGTVGASILAGIIPIVLSIIATAILQGLISLEVARGTLGERLRFGGLWRLARGRIGALIGWSFLLTAALLVVTVVLSLILGLGIASGDGVGIAVAVIVTLLLGLVVFAASIWLGTKLALVPSVLMLERTTLRAAIARSWSLTNGAFWRTFGTLLLVYVIVQAAAQVVSLPLSILTGFGGGLLNPNGSEEGLIAMSVVVLLASGVLSVVFGAVSLVILSSVTALIYIDLRMRKEGLDLELARFVEARQAGSTSVENPYETIQSATGDGAPSSTVLPGASDSPWA